MIDGKDASAALQDARMMDESSILLDFSNGFSVLVDSEEIKKVIMNSGAKILHKDEVFD